MALRRNITRIMIIIAVILSVFATVTVYASASSADPLTNDGIQVVGNIEFTQENNVITVSSEKACKIGYYDGGKYVIVCAESNGEGGCSFDLPVGATQVLAVISGDVNLDGRVTAADIARLNAHMLGKITVGADALFAGDVDGDGKAASDDIAKMTDDILRINALAFIEHSYSNGVCTVCGCSDEVHTHSTVTVPGTPATERTFGMSDYVYCSTCSEVISEQTLLLPLGIENPDYYASNWGYEYLATLPNGEAMQKFYLALDEELKNFHINTDRVPDKNGFINPVNYSKLGLTLDEAGTVYSILKDERPIYYWLAGKYAWTSSSFYVVVDENYRDSSVREYYNDLVYAKAAEYLKLIINETSEYQIAWALHDAICINASYAYMSDGETPESAVWAHSILGILEKNSGVCESYAEVFGMLLNFAEVENIRVTGTGNGGAHAWNLVKLDDGEWYWYDLTWDDRDSGDAYEIFHGYAAVTDYGTVTVKIGRLSFAPVYFLEKHTIGTNYDYGVNYNPVLPERAADPFKTSDTMVHDTFTYEGTTYQIIRFDTVYCSSYLGINGTPPETITYNGREYKVIIGQY